MNVEELKTECEREGLVVHRCSEHHFQIKDFVGNTLVDVWPTTNRFRWHGAAENVKAKNGSARQAVKQAMFSAKKLVEVGLPGGARKATAGVDLLFGPGFTPIDADPEPTVAEIDRLAAAHDKQTKKSPEEKRERRYKHLLHLALLRLSLHPGKLNDALVSEIYEVL